MTKELWPDLLVPAEHAFLRSIPPGDRERLATAMFAVKEAFYKFQFPLTREWIGFTDVELIMSRGSDTCRVRPHRPLPIGGKKRNEFTADFKIGASLTLAAVSLSE